jgi:hypothetical protein
MKIFRSFFILCAGLALPGMTFGADCPTTATPGGLTPASIKASLPAHTLGMDDDLTGPVKVSADGSVFGIQGDENQTELNQYYSETVGKFVLVVDARSMNPVMDYRKMITSKREGIWDFSLSEKGDWIAVAHDDGVDVQRIGDDSTRTRHYYPSETTQVSFCSDGRLQIQSQGNTTLVEGVR